MINIPGFAYGYIIIAGILNPKPCLPIGGGGNMIIKTTIIIPWKYYCSAIPIRTLHYTINHICYPLHSKFNISGRMFTNRGAWNHPWYIWQGTSFQIIKYPSLYHSGKVTLPWNRCPNSILKRSSHNQFIFYREIIDYNKLRSKS